MTEISRRQFLTTAGTVGAAAVIGTAPATAEPDPTWTADHITHVGDDLEELKRYQPYYDISISDRQEMIGTYGWYADSEDYDHRAYYFWTKYAYQGSSFDWLPILGSWFEPDAHGGDHEPFIVMVDTSTGEVQEVIYTAYHHYAAHLEADEATLVQDFDDHRETHMSLEVVSPHHHYQHQRDGDRGVPASNIAEAEFGSFLEQEWKWAQNDVWESSSNEAVYDPWAAKDRGNWWKDGSRDQRFARLRIALNWRDASDRDTLIRD